MKVENFKEHEIPYEEFEKLGYTREKVMALSRDDLEQLLSGKRTKLLTISRIDGLETELDIRAKFSLKRNTDGTVTLMVHPVREKIENDIKLTAYEINRLKEDRIINKKIDGERYLVQLDKENNELLKVKTKDMMIPTHIGSIELSPSQREHLKKGNPITVESQDYKINVNIDLNNRSGLRIDNLTDLDLKRKMEFDRLNPGVNGFVQTDENRNEYDEYVKRQNGIKI